MPRTPIHGQPLPTNEDDLIIGGYGKDKVFAGAGNDTLVGGMGNDVFIAGAGNDVLIAGWGHDRLIGGPGHDTFVFNHVLNAGADALAYNFSTIAHFNPVMDTIELSHRIFSAIAPGVLSAHAFSIGGGANDTSDRIIYNPHNGYLIYDPDGSGFLNGIEFAKLAPHLHLTHSDFLIVG
jgi:Ca2+-binding RTX toxin-like protein